MLTATASNYRLWKSTGGAPQIVASTVNTSTAIVRGTGITNLTASWGISERLASYTIGGSVLTPGGAGIRSAIVTLTGGNLPAPLVVQTGNFGTYSFPAVEAATNIPFVSSAKRQRFASPSQVLVLTGNLTNLDFVANPSD